MQRLVRLALDRPLLVLGALLLVTAGLGSGIPSLRTESGYRAYLGSEHVAIRELDRFIAGFGGGLPVAAVWSCAQTPACESVFDAAALRMAHEVVRSLEFVDGIRRIESPATAPLLIADADTLSSRRLVERGEVAPDRAALAQRAVQDPMWRGLLVSEDAQVGAIVLQLSSSDSATSQRIVDALEQALAPHEAAGFHFHRVGQAVQLVVTDEELAADSQRLIPLMIGIVATIVLVLFRSWQSVVVALATVGMASAWTVGGMARLGWPDNAVTQTIPPLILVIGLCDAIHYLSRYRRHRTAGGRGRREALLAGAGDVGLPCVVTSLTTAAGFLSFSTSGLLSFVRFGQVAAFGILAALLLTFTVLPILISWLPEERLRGDRSTELWDRALHILVDGTQRRARPILTVAAILAVACLWGVAQVEVDVDEYELLGEGSEIVRGYRFVESHLQNPDTLELELVVPEDADPYDPETLAQVQRLGERLETISSLGPAHSVVDAVAWAHRTLDGGAAGSGELPGSAIRVATILELLGWKDPAILDQWISLDRRRFRLSVEAEKLPKTERAGVLRAVDRAVEGELGPGWQTTVTGPFAVYYDMVTEVQRTQIRSFGVAAVIVFLLLWLFLVRMGRRAYHAFGWAIIGIVPTLLPVVATLGVMGLAGIPLDVGTAMIAAILIGIAIDDTVHLLGDFTRQRDHHEDPAEAMRHAMLHVGQAVITTSVALSLGFITLTFSSWQAVSSFGFLSGLAILGALLADLLVLPALIFVVTRARGRFRWIEAPTPHEEAEQARGKSRQIALFTAAPVLGTLLIAAAGQLSGPPKRILACRLLPNGAIPLVTTLDSDCPLQPYDRIVALELDGKTLTPPFDRSLLKGVGSPTLQARYERAGDKASASIPLVDDNTPDQIARLALSAALSLLILLMGLRIYAQSLAAAALPLVFLFALLGIWIIALLCHTHGPLLPALGAVAAGLFPATLAHLALTFPRVRPLARQAPGVIAAPYAVGAFLAAAQVTSLSGASGLWLLSSRAAAILTGAAWVWLVLSNLRAYRESRSLLDRARAKLLLTGAACAPFAFTPLYLGASNLVPGGSVFLLIATVAAFALPLGYAITRYQLFDLALDVRRALDRFLQVVSYGVVTASACGLLHKLASIEGPPLWIAGAFIGGFVSHRLHRRLRALVDHEDVARRQQLLLQHGQEMRRLSQRPDRIARATAETLSRGLPATDVAIFLRQGHRVEPAYAIGTGIGICTELAAAALAALEPHDLLHLERGDVRPSPEVVHLQTANVRMLVALRAEKELIGVGLVGPQASGRPFSSDELDFASGVAGQSAMALHNVRLAEELVRAERHAAMGVMATGLAHDLLNPLRMIERHAQRFQERQAGCSAAHEEIRKVEDIARYLVSTVSDAVQAVTQQETAQQEKSVPVPEIIARAVRAIPGVSDSDRIAVNPAPGLPEVPEPNAVTRILANLLDNALTSSPAGDPVCVYATCEPGFVRIEVTDYGPGMSSETLERAFDLFFTTRADEGGAGIGLAVARSIAEGLGGSLELESKPGEGARAILRVPAVSGGHTVA